MGREKPGLSKVVGAVSRQTGAAVGTSVAISKKMTGYGIKGMAAMRDLVMRPIRKSAPVTDKQDKYTSQASSLETEAKVEPGRKEAAKALIATLESELAAAQHELKKARSIAENTQSKLSSQLCELKAEKQSLISNLKQAKSKANEAAAREDKVKTQISALEYDLAVAQDYLEKPHKKKQDAKSKPASGFREARPKEETMLYNQAKNVESAPSQTAAQSVEQLDVKIEEKLSLGPFEDELKSAVFSRETDRIIFTRAFSDIASQQAAVRADAVRAIATIRHELTLKVLASQMVHEPSALVRQECIRALTAIQMGQAQPMIVHALTDRAATVRLAAVWGLYRLAGAESYPELKRMLSDEDEEVRRRTVTCIGWLGQEEFAVALIPLLTDKSISVRRAAIDVMGKLRSRQVVTALIEHLNDPNISVRKDILRAIETITGKKMSGPFPASEKALQRLIARWHEWWKEELLG